MITAIVRYQLPLHIDHVACREHFHRIAPGFQRVKGLISKHFIWSESGWAGGVYQWETREDAQVFYGGAWLDGIVERYGIRPRVLRGLRADRQRARTGRPLPGGHPRCSTMRTTFDIPTSRA
jgi:hypothetical protein